MHKVIFFLIFTFFMSSFSVQAADTYINSIDMEFVFIPAGSFFMGSDKKIKNVKKEEIPRHYINISNDFYIGRYEVTQAQWTAVMGDNPSVFSHPDNPVENVSWNDINIFINLLNKKEGHNRYSLPTEAQWEYAARAGSETAYFFGNDPKELGNYAWYEDNSEEKTHMIGQKKPNDWGLFDVLGNVREWTQDFFDENYYSESPDADPEGPASGQNRVVRGGGYGAGPGGCRSGYRSGYSPDERIRSVGFRLALAIDR
jgi:formylglycine-generating enzyme required for sulfatase activity